MDIFVGNLSYDSTEANVRNLFKGFGDVASVEIVMNKKGSRSRGFAFVEMPDDEQAKAAIAAIDGKEFMGRALNVSQKQSKSGASPKRGKREGYKKGRRSLSFMKRHAAAGIEEQGEAKIKRLSGRPGHGKEDRRDSSGSSR